MNGEAVKEIIRLTNINVRPPLQVFFEEDILVPDVKPDVARIGLSEVRPKLTEKESYGGNLHLSGDLYLDVVYMPSIRDDSVMESVSVRIPFRHEAQGEGSSGELEIIPEAEHLEVTVINERKLRMKTIISFSVREYEEIERNIFKGFRDEHAELLREKVSYTDISRHNRDFVEIKEEAAIKEGMPEIGYVLKNNFRVAETDRQVLPDKAIVSGRVFYNIMYMSDESESKPVTMDGSIDFTQFIRLEDCGEICGSDLLMKVDDGKVTPKRDAEDNLTIFDISVSIATRIDVYTQKELELIKDAYHSKKVLDIERESIKLLKFGGSGSADVNVREKIELNGAAEIGQIVFACGEALTVGGEIDNGKFVAEGVLEAEIVYLDADENGIRNHVSEIPFRAIIEVPGMKKEMEISVEFVVKNIYAEKINHRQAEIKGEIYIVAKGYENEIIDYIKKAGLLEDIPEKEDNITRLILYMTKNDERLWDIGKCYRVPVEEIKKVNGIDSSIDADFTLDRGNKLLIWA